MSVKNSLIASKELAFKTDYSQTLLKRIEQLEQDADLKTKLDASIFEKNSIRTDLMQLIKQSRSGQVLD